MKRTDWRGLVALGGILLAALTARAGFTLEGGAKSVRIPVEIQNNIVLIPLRVNGSFEMSFILDTGVRTTILTESVISNFLQLDSVTRVRVRGLGDGEAIDAYMARNVGISLPGANGRGMHLIILPEGMISFSGMFGKPVYGIIGYEVFGQFTVEINYAQKYIVLHDPFHYKPRGKWAELPIDIRNGKPYAMADLIDHRGERIRSRWLIDTGASMGVSLFDEGLPLPGRSVEAFLGQGLSGSVYGRLGRSQALEFAGFRLERVITGYPEPGSLNLALGDSTWYGNIGAEIISRFQAVFDYTNGRVLLRKGHLYKKPFRYNVSGLEVIATGLDYSSYRISYVRPGSEAERLGVQLQDELLALNGSLAKGMPMEEVYQFLSGTRRQLVLRVRRGSETLRFVIPLAEEL
jgi:hypothetical protein